MGPHALIVAPASARTPLLRLFAARTRIALAFDPPRGTSYVRRPRRSTRRLLGRRRRHGCRVTVALSGCAFPPRAPYSKRSPMQPARAESARLNPTGLSTCRSERPEVVASGDSFFWPFCLRRSSCWRLSFWEERYCACFDPIPAVPSCRVATRAIRSGVSARQGLCSGA